MKSLKDFISESIVDEGKGVKIDDMSEEDRIILSRSFNTDESIGYHMLTIDGKKDTMDSFYAYMDELKKEYGDSVVADGDEHNSYLTLTHSVLNIVAHQMVDNQSYQDALKDEIKRINDSQYTSKDCKEKVIETIKKDKLGKDVKRWLVQAPIAMYGYGNRKDLERRLEAIKSNAEYQHKYLPHGWRP